MTSTTTTISCGNCGVVDLGTRFCETCGAALRTAPAPVAANPSPSAPEDPREFTMAYRIYLAAYLAGWLAGWSRSPQNLRPTRYTKEA